MRTTKVNTNVNFIGLLLYLVVERVEYTSLHVMKTSEVTIGVIYNKYCIMIYSLTQEMVSMIV